MDERFPPDDSPADPQDHSGTDSEHEEDLDSLLAEASALATEVSEELGRTEDLPDTRAGQTPGTHLNSYDTAASSESGQDVPVPVDDVDSQLSQVDDLLRDTAIQIGSGTAGLDGTTDSESAKETPGLIDDASRSSGADNRSSAGSLDDSNTAGQERKNATAPAGTEANASAGTTGSPGFARIGVVSAKPVNTNGEVVSADSPPANAIGEPAPNEHSAEMDVEFPTDPAREGAAGTGTRLAVAALLACEHGVSILERLDKPLRRVGNRPRRVIGWIAIATTSVSLIALILSLF